MTAQAHPGYAAPHELSWLGALASFPTVGTVLEDGREAWSAFIARSTRGDRERVLREFAPWWRGPELLGTKAAEERLARWFALGRPTPSRRVLERDLVVLGLDSVRSLVVGVIRKTPPPVA